MGKPIEISLVANTRAFTSGTDDAAKALDKVADSLDDLTRESQRSADRTGDAIAHGIEDGTDKAETEVERLNRSFRELATEARRTSSSAGDDLGDGVRRGTGQAGESVREFGNEARQNIGETFSSFRGDVSDFGQIAQDTLGGLSTSLGGIPGIALTAAGAAGIGLILAALDQGSKDSEAFKARVSELATELIDTGKTGGASVEFLADKLKELATSTEDGATNLADLRDAATDANAPFEDLAQAYAGNSEGLDDLIRKSEDYYDALDQEQVGLDLSTEAGNRRNKVIADTLAGRERYLGYLYDSKAANEQAAQAEADYAASGGPEMEVKADLIDNIADSYDSARDAAAQAAAAEGDFSVDKFLDEVEKQKAGVEQYKTNLESLRLTPEQWENFLALPDDARAAIAASYASAGEEGRTRIEQALSDAGTNAGQGAKVGFESSFGKPKADVSVTVETDKARAEVSNFVDSKRRIEIPVEARVDEARTRLDGLVRDERVAIVRADVRTAAAYADLNNLVAERTATVRVRYVDNATGRITVP